MRGHVIVGVMTISTDVDKPYDTDLTDAAWALIAPMLPAARPGGRPRKINIRAVLNAIFYLLRTGCQWRLLPREFPGWSTVYHYFRAWKNAGVWTCIQRSVYHQARRQAGRVACPSTAGRAPNNLDFAIAYDGFISSLDRSRGIWGAFRAHRAGPSLRSMQLLALLEQLDDIARTEVVKSDIHSTDAFGFSEMVFAVSHLLGFSYAPRFKNFPRQRLYIFKSRR